MTEGIKLKQYLSIGMVFALAGEIFNNFIAKHNSTAIIFVIIPVYFLFLLIIGKIYQRVNWQPLFFSIVFGLLALLLIENLMLKKYTENWLIQIFMLSFWISIISYPIVVAVKGRRILAKPFLVAFIAAFIGYVIKQEIFLSLSLFQVAFWVVSAVANLQYMRGLKIELK